MWILLGLVVAVCIVGVISFQRQLPPSPDMEAKPNTAEKPNAMRCPGCGGPAQIRGSIWSCGRCGESGDVKP